MFLYSFWNYFDYEYPQNWTTKPLVTLHTFFESNRLCLTISAPNSHKQFFNLSTNQHEDFWHSHFVVFWVGKQHNQLLSIHFDWKLKIFYLKIELKMNQNMSKISNYEGIELSSANHLKFDKIMKFDQSEEVQNQFDKKKERNFHDHHLRKWSKKWNKI